MPLLLRHLPPTLCWPRVFLLRFVRFCFFGNSRPLRLSPSVLRLPASSYILYRDHAVLYISYSFPLRSSTTLFPPSIPTSSFLLPLYSRVSVWPPFPSLRFPSSFTVAFPFQWLHEKRQLYSVAGQRRRKEERDGVKEKGGKKARNEGGQE